MSLEQKQSSGWMNFERRNWVACLVLSGCLGFAAGNGHTTQGAVEHISKQLGDAKGQLGAVKKIAKVAVNSEQCEHWRAEQAARVAKRAILAANVDSIEPPYEEELPQDVCPHPVAAK